MSFIDVTSKTFDEEVTSHDEPVIVDFWADWCNPCKQLSFEIDKLSRRFPNLKICKVNIDSDLDLAKKYKVSSIPTLLLFKNGSISKRIEKFKKAEEIEAVFEL